MRLDVVDFVAIGVYFTVVLWIGVRIGRRQKDDKDYFLGGRSLPFWAIGFSIVGTDIGAIDFVGLIGNGYRYGIAAANMDWIGSMPALLLAAFIFVPFYWRAGVYSVPEFLGRRYDQRVRLVQTVAWTLFLVLNIGVLLCAASKWLDGLLGWSPWVTVPGMAAIIGFYTVSGGLAAVVYSDVLQVIVMLFGGFAVLGVGLYKVGGLAELERRLVELGDAQHLSLYLPADSPSPYGWPGVFFGLTLVLAPAYFIGNQAIVQRTLGARDEWAAKAAALFGCFFKFLIPFVVVLPGLVGRVLYPQIEDGDQVFAHMVKDLLFPGVRGLVIAALVAAFMSTADGILNSAATLITQDLYVGILKGRSDSQRLLSLGRRVTFALIVFGALTTPLAFLFFAGVYEAMQSLLAVIQGPTFAILFLGMFWSRATGAGGLASVLVGYATSLSLTLVHKLWTPLFAANDPFLLISPIAFAVTVAVNVAVSLWTSPPRRETLEGLVFRWRLPARRRAASPPEL